MRDKWVDSNGYFGPDRRRRPVQKRWGERRGLDEAGEPPPLGAMLRRIRVLMMDLSAPDDRRRVLQLLTAAITSAERQRFFQCADALKAADRTLRLGGSGDVSTADARVVEALGHAGAQR
jgi:hypothetical protein